MFLVPLVQCLCSKSISLIILKGEMLGILEQDTEKKVVNMPNVVVVLFHRSKTDLMCELPEGHGPWKRASKWPFVACSMQRRKFVRNFEARNSPSSTIWSEPRLLFRDQMLVTWHHDSSQSSPRSKRYLMISIQVKQEEMCSIVNNIRAKVTHAGSNIFEFSWSFSRKTPEN